MKKTFEFQETVTYNHKIEVEIDAAQEEYFEEFADEMADRIDSDNGNISRDDIEDSFWKRFGDNVTFVEDGSPDVEYEAY